MSTNIDDIIRLFVRRQATAEQRRQVKEYIYDNADNFNVLLRIMREEAMKDMGLNPDDDFLPELLKERSPQAFGECPAFSCYNNKQIISADFADGESDDDIFGHLCREILYEQPAWY